MLYIRICPSPRDIRGNIIFLRGSFALCPGVFLTLTETFTINLDKGAGEDLRSNVEPTPPCSAVRILASQFIDVMRK